MHAPGLIDLKCIHAEPASHIWENLAIVRRQLAGAWLSLSPELVQAACPDELGRFHRLLIDAGVIDEAATEADSSLMSEISRRLELPGVPDPGTILAESLYFHPHLAGRIIDPEHVPAYLLQEFLRFSFTMPSIFRRPGEPDAYRHYLHACLKFYYDKLVAGSNATFWNNVADRSAYIANFTPIYFSSENLRELMTLRARLIEHILRLKGHAIDYSFSPRPRRRIRLGILAGHFMPKTETFATLPVYRDLDRSKFEIVLLAMLATGEPPEKVCASYAERFIVLPPQLDHQVQVIRQLDLDALWIATNVTAVANPITLLAPHRLARVQIASVCSCCTTGMSNIDYYVSGTLTEADAAQDHYTENLLMVDGPAHCYDFELEKAPADAAPLNRSDLGIDPNTTVFASGANYFKILPELDHVWARILAAVPGSRLLLYPFNPNWRQIYPVRAFAERLGSNFARYNVSPDRLLLFTRAEKRSHVLSRLAVADIYLDSFPFSGATSLIDPLQLGIPPVVLNGRNFRSLVGPALLRDLKLDDLIARSEDEYINLAIRLSSDATWRAEVKARVITAMARGPRFLDSKWYAGEIGRFLTELINARCT
jgi:predicted O-linked N-acetylglucosamine transferase (SPINDLY family)